MSKNIKTIPTSEYDEVIRVVQEYYVDGLRVGSTATVAKSFHKDATMYGLTLDGVLPGSPVKNRYDFMDQHGDAPKIKTRLDVVGITPTTAVVKVDMENDAAGCDYTDFHTMIRLDGKWQIVAKVLIYSYSAYELMALAWDRPYEEFMEPMDEKVWNQTSWSTFDGAPQDVVFEHRFSIRRIQTKIRKFWNEFENLNL